MQETMQQIVNCFSRYCWISWSRNACTRRHSKCYKTKLQGWYYSRREKFIGQYFNYTVAELVFFRATFINLEPCCCTCTFFDTQNVTVSCQPEVVLWDQWTWVACEWLFLMDPNGKAEQSDERQNCACTRSWRVLLLGFQRRYLKRVSTILMKWSMRNQRMMECVLRYMQWNLIC